MLVPFTKAVEVVGDHGPGTVAFRCPLVKGTPFATPHVCPRSAWTLQMRLMEGFDVARNVTSNWLVLKREPPFSHDKNAEDLRVILSAVPSSMQFSDVNARLEGFVWMKSMLSVQMPEGCRCDIESPHRHIIGKMHP